MVDKGLGREKRGATTFDRYSGHELSEDMEVEACVTTWDGERSQKRLLAIVSSKPMFGERTIRRNDGMSKVIELKSPLSEDHS